MPAATEEMSRCSFATRLSDHTELKASQTTTLHEDRHF
jgi:hypothetical protein